MNFTINRFKQFILLYQTFSVLVRAFVGVSNEPRVRRECLIKFLTENMRPKIYAELARLFQYFYLLFGTTVTPKRWQNKTRLFDTRPAAEIKSFLFDFLASSLRQNVVATEEESKRFGRNGVISLLLLAFLIHGANLETALLLAISVSTILWIS